MNENLIEEIYKYINNFLENQDESKVKLVIKMQMRKCLNYMNRQDFPPELVDPLAEAIIFESNPSEIQSMKMGDTQFTYSNSDKIAISLKSQLNKYRKVGTVNGNT